MPTPPAPGRRGRTGRLLLRLTTGLAGLIVVAVVVLAGLGVYFLRLRVEYPATGLVLAARAEMPAGDGDGESHVDYVYGERLGEVRSRTPKSGLGSAERRGGARPSFYELRDGQGRTVARATAIAPGETPAGVGADGARFRQALHIEVSDGGETLLHRLTQVASDDGSAMHEDLYALGAKGLVRARRVSEERGLLGLLGRWPLRRTRVLAFGEGAGPAGRLVLDTLEDGVVDLLPQGAALSFLTTSPGLFARMFGTEPAALRFRFRTSARLALVPWTVAARGYRVRDGQGDLAAVDIEHFWLRYRGQVLYRYLVDLDGDGRLSPETETIETVLVSRKPAAAPAREAVEVAFLAGVARLDDLEALRLGDAVEAFLPDACLKGFGRDSDLGLVEQARDDALALLEPTPFTVAAALSPVDALRSPHAWTALARAGRRPYADAMATALGERLEDPRFAAPKDLRALGPRPGLAPAAAGATEPATGGVPSAPAEGAPAPSATGLPPMEEPDARLLAHAQGLLHELGHAVWPGFGERIPPVVLVGADVEWLLGHPHPPPGFEPQGDYPGLDSTVLVRKRTFDPSFQAAFPIEGTPTVVLGTPAGTGLAPARWALTYVHEAFHAFQMENGEFERTARLAHLARGDATGMWQIQYPFPYGDPAAGQALALFGTALDRGAGALAGGMASGTEPRATTDAARAALAAAEALDALVPAEDVDYLRFVEWKEGTARYVELRTAHLAAAAGIVPPSPTTAAPYSDAAKDIDDAVRETLRGLGPGRLRRESLYATGAVLARLLDSRLPGWTDRYFDPASTLETLLGETLPAERPAPGAAPERVRHASPADPRPSAMASPSPTSAAASEIPSGSPSPSGSAETAPVASPSPTP